MNSSHKVGPRIIVAFVLVYVATSLVLPFGRASAAAFVLDPSFGNGGIVTGPVLAGDLLSVGLQLDGKAVVGGFTNTNGLNAQLARHNVDGSLDASFGTAGMFTHDFGFATSADGGVEIQTDGKVVFAGEAEVFCACGGYGHKLLAGRLNADGTADATFGTDGFVVLSVPNMVDVNTHNLTIQPDGKILVIGTTNQGDGVNSPWFIARFDTNGTPDPTFGNQGFKVTHPIGGSTYDDAWNVAVQADGKILVVGHAAGTRPITARFTSNGSLDATFGVNGVVDEYPQFGQEVVTDVTTQADGKIVVSAGSASNMYALRYNPDGSRDTSFANNGLFSNSFGSSDVAALSVAIQADGKIVLGGQWGINGDRDFALTRLQTNGIIDTSFGGGGLVTTNIGSNVDFVGKLLLANDKIIAGGISGNIAQPYILARYNESQGAQLTSLGPVKAWVGLKNSDDVGTKFDLLTEVYKDNTLVASGHLNGFAGGSSGFNNSHLATIPMDAFAPVDFPAGTQLKVKLLVRNACIGSGHNSGVARLWYNDSAANTGLNATIGGGSQDYYLWNAFALGTVAGPGPKKTIDVQSGAKCSPFKSFGTWSVTL